MAPEIASHRETQNEPPLTLGSLFDGIGVFPLAASRHGIVPLWASEIEKAPISITRRHFPEMEHLGDITKMDGGQIPAVHILTFGSPCQNLSQIGDRSGLAGAKSSLFHHAIRIIKEMRCATGGQFPIIALWENVMGALSSNDRLDFLAVLRSFQDAPFSVPPSGRWANAGNGAREMSRSGLAAYGRPILGKPPPGTTATYLSRGRFWRAASSRNTV